MVYSTGMPVLCVSVNSPLIKQNGRLLKQNLYTLTLQGKPPIRKIYEYISYIAPRPYLMPDQSQYKIGLLKFKSNLSRKRISPPLPHPTSVSIMYTCIGRKPQILLMLFTMNPMLQILQFYYRKVGNGWPSQHNEM